MYSVLFQIGAFAVIKMNTTRGILVGCLLSGGIIFFFVISKIGQKLQSKHEAKLEAEKMDTEKSVESLEISSLQDTSQEIKYPKISSL